MAAVVGIVHNHGLRIEVCCTNQHNKSKLTLYKLLLNFNSCSKTKASSILKVIMVTVGIIHKSRRLKEKLSWAIDKLLQVIYNVFKTVIPLRN